MIPGKLWPLALASLLLVACSEELQHNLTEQDANDILVLLSENGISSKKVKEEGGNEPTFLVRVPKQDYRQAAKLLREYSLPRPRTEGWAAFRKSKGMIPTQTEERAMYLEALGGEVSMALMKIDSILEARTLVMLPENNDLTQPDKKPLPSASVLVRYRPGVDGKPPLDEIMLKKFVANAVPELRPEAVAVLMSQAVPPAAEAGGEARLQDVLGFRMTSESAKQFRLAIGATALVVLLLTLVTGWVVLRAGGESGRPRTRTRTES